MLKLGILLTSATVTILVAEFFRARTRAFPLHGWLGLFALICAEYLMFHGIEPVATYFTPIAWTAYILIADAATDAISGRSRLRENPFGVLKMAALSVPLWLIFEAYNLRLSNWTYVGLPANRFESWFGYAWSFATITPGIFGAADLVESFGWFERKSRPVRFSQRAANAFLLLGVFCLVAPLVIPRNAAAYSFGLVWLGFLFSLEPINRRVGIPSFMEDVERGCRGRVYSFLIAGWVCGWLWEFWNYWARARWIYTFPIAQQWKIFQMPAPGYLGFPMFALECFAMYASAASLVSGRFIAEKKYQE